MVLVMNRRGSPVFLSLEGGKGGEGREGKGGRREGEKHDVMLIIGGRGEEGGGETQCDAHN